MGEEEVFLAEGIAYSKSKDRYRDIICRTQCKVKTWDLYVKKKTKKRGLGGKEFLVVSLLMIG